MPVTVAADLRFAIEVEGGDSVHGHLHGSDSRLVLEVDDPAAFAGRGDAPAIRMLAEGMAARGLVVRVMHGGQHLVSVGAVRAPWWQKRLTGTRRIRLGSLRGAWTSARARARGVGSVLPDADMAPPTTPWPPLPTFARWHRPSPTTTHDPARGGAARLVLSKQVVWDGERQPVFRLGDETSIGSDPGCDIVLPGIEPRQAVVRHDEADEYVVETLAGTTRVHGQDAAGQLLRTGARIDLGEHHLVFYREEFADHGRPYGGRVGGEAGTQRPQPPRTAPAATGEWSGGSPD